MDGPATAADTGTIERELFVEASPDIVFAHFVDPERIRRWMGRTVAFDPRRGGEWRIDYNGSDIARGQVVEIDPPWRLVYTWGWEAPEQIVRPGGSTVEVTLTAEGGGTRLRLRHSGLPDAEVASHAQGWDQFLPNLGAAVARG
jgi:uncharacterized protein YndB with AHSA1/START domain